MKRLLKHLNNITILKLLSAVENNQTRINLINCYIELNKIRFRKIF